jgi:hypothetical protein
VSGLDSEMGSDQGTYFDWGSPGDIQSAQRTSPIGGLRYYNVLMEFHLDHRHPHEGGRGYFKAWVDGIKVMDYIGPTMWPTPQSGTYVEPVLRFGMYNYNLDGAYTDDVTLNSARGMINTKILWVRKFRLLSVGGV